MMHTIATVFQIQNNLACLRRSLTVCQLSSAVRFSRTLQKHAVCRLTAEFQAFVLYPQF